jgi:RNA polymerase sigma-70 factor (ECF subfamily)
MEAVPNTPSDEELAQECQQGSLTAFEELVYRYEGRLYRFVANCCGNKTDAEEITQDSFVKAFQAIGQFNPRHTFAAWLFTIARRKCVDLQRRAAFSTGEPLPDASELDDPSVLLARAEASRNIWGMARGTLPAVQFEALWLRYAEEMDLAQIGRVLHKTRTHVKVLLFRARNTLGEQLAADAPEPAGARSAAAARPKLTYGSALPTPLMCL